jgi:hypothetical protein
MRVEERATPPGEPPPRRRRLPTLLLGLVVGLAAVGIAFRAFGGGSDDASAPDGIFFPRFDDSQDAYPAALAFGTLVLEDGCIFLENAPSPRLLLLWPDGARLESTGDGGYRITYDGSPIARIGEYVYVGGGLVGEAADETDFPEQLIGTTIPARCRADGGYWYTDPDISPNAPG